MTLDEVIIGNNQSEGINPEEVGAQSLFEGRVGEESPLNLEPTGYGRNLCLITNPRRVIPMEEFLRTAEGASVGLNGAVKGSTEYINTERGIYFNFNNSDDVNVLATRSTAAQVLVSIRQGMMDGIDKQLMPLDVYVGDASPDTALAVWLLENYELFSGKAAQEKIVALVHCIDMLESTEHAYPFDPEQKGMQEVAWIFEPYQEARRTGKLELLSSAELNSIIKDIGSRISKYANGSGDTRLLDTRYDLIARGLKGDWAMVEEVGCHARTGMFQDGIHQYVVVRSNEDNTHSYDIGKMSAYQNFPVEDLLHVLNQKEEMNSGRTGIWKKARGDGTGGVALHSSLTPAQVAKTIDAFLEVARPYLFMNYPREVTEAELPDGLVMRQVCDHMTIIAGAGVTMSLDEAKDTLPGYALTLDGFVNERPSVSFQKKGPIANLNHHEDVDRLSTRSTCGQIYVGLRQGLAEAFSAPGTGVRFHACINDCDQDVCMSLWLLRNQERIRSLKPEQQQRLVNLVYAEDLLDVTAGAYPFPPNSTLMKEVAWTFEPYNSQRFSLNQGSPRENAEQYLDIIEEVHRRINRYVLGAAEEAKVSDSVTVLGEGPSWKMIHEPEVGGRTQLFAEGTKAFVALLNDGADGVYRYSIGKMSPYVPFPINTLYQALNEAEGIEDPREGWGGSDTIGGSPRQTGSKLSPEEVTRIINEVIEKEREDKPHRFRVRKRLLVPGERSYSTS